jgi:hypothetical protein
MLHENHVCVFVSFTSIIHMNKRFEIFSLTNIGTWLVLLSLRVDVPFLSVSSSEWFRSQFIMFTHYVYLQYNNKQRWNFNPVHKDNCKNREYITSKHRRQPVPLVNIIYKYYVCTKGAGCLDCTTP